MAVEAAVGSRLEGAGEACERAGGGCWWITVGCPEIKMSGAENKRVLVHWTMLQCIQLFQFVIHHATTYWICHSPMCFFVMWCIVVSYYLFAGSFASLFTLHEYLYHMTCISLCKSTCVDSFHLLVTGMLSRSHSGKSKVKAISSQRSLLKFTRIQWSSG